MVTLFIDTCNRMLAVGLAKNNQIIYTTHSPYLIDTEKIGQIRLVEKLGIDGECGYNEVSEIRERIHHSSNNTLS